MCRWRWHTGLVSVLAANLESYCNRLFYRLCCRTSSSGSGIWSGLCNGVRLSTAAAEYALSFSHSFWVTGGCPALRRASNPESILNK